MMKKMLMMTAVAAMAFGAQADDTYKYDLTLTGIPLSVLQSDKLKCVRCYLADNSVTGGKTVEDVKGSVMAEFYFEGKDWVNYDGSGNVTGLRYTSVSYNMQGGLAGGSTTTEITANLQPSSALYTFQPFSAEKISWKNMGATPNEVTNYGKEYLGAYIFAELQDRPTLALDPLEVIASGAISTIGSYATYETVIPEPTSGMLVFLGLAGLMLKRKRAA